MGAKRQPHYRIVVADSRSPRDGRFVEMIGYYNPKTTPMTLNIDTERARHWVDMGAKPSETVRALFVRAGIIEGKIRKKGEEEGYVTEVPRYREEPTVIAAYTRPEATETAKEEAEATA